MIWDEVEFFMTLLVDNKLVPINWRNIQNCLKTVSNHVRLRTELVRLQAPCCHHSPVVSIYHWRPADPYTSHLRLNHVPSRLRPRPAVPSYSSLQLADWRISNISLTQQTSVCGPPRRRHTWASGETWRMGMKRRSDLTCSEWHGGHRLSGVHIY